MLNYDGRLMRRIVSFLTGAALLTGVAGRVRAQESGGAAGGAAAAAVSRGEGWLGEGSDLGLELAHVVAAGKRGGAGTALRDLELISAEAKARGLKEVWLHAQQWWVRFTLLEQPESDLTPAVEELLAWSKTWNLPSEEAEVHALWGEVLKAQGQWLMAVKAQDRTTQLALDAGRVARAVEAFLEMARLCRGAGHGWRLGQVWARMDLVLKERPVELPEGLADALKTERELGAVLLAQAGRTAAAATPAVAGGVDLQPKDSRVLVSAPDREVGRSRFLLTNGSSWGVEGILTVTADQAGVSGWQGGEGGLYITLAKGAAQSGSRKVRLRPGQQLEVYVEHDPGVSEDAVKVVWSGDGGGAAKAGGTFYFAEGLPTSSLVNAGVFQLQAGWSIPLYHEIYHRGRRARVQNFQVSASAACRLEVYDHDTGRLLGIDAQGDGDFHGPGDQVMEDADRDGWPDLVIGDRARAIEICAWPLGVTGAGITVSAGLRGDDGAVTGDVENTVLGVVPDGVRTAGRPRG
ncbi:MAG: hypothetical protein JWL81_337 [Verrucomicrobiales bacterium]|nr:hypothetical protein [Verrucomicrobiales bacterium]